MQYQEYLIEKVFKLTILGILMTIMLTACNTEQLPTFDSEPPNDVSIQNDPVQVGDELVPEEEPVGEQIEKPKSTLLDELLNADAASYGIKKERHELSEEFWVEYPQLDNISNLEIQDNINSIIKDFVWNIFPQFEEPQMREDVYHYPPVGVEGEPYTVTPEYNVKYEIKFSNEKFLSIAFFRFSYAGGYIASSFRDECHTLNFDLETAEIFKTTDMFNIDEGFILKAFKEEHSIVFEGELLDKALHLSEIEKWTEWYSKRIAEGTYSHFYFTVDKLGIVEDLHSIFSPDYNILEIPYSELEEFKVMVPVS